MDLVQISTLEMYCKSGMFVRGFIGLGDFKQFYIKTN